MTTIAGVKLADMKRSKESLSPKNVGKIAPDPYSYEHRISLDEDAMDKLGMNELPKVGAQYHVHGIAHVASVNLNERGGDKKQRKNVSLQLHKMAVIPAPKSQPSTTGGAKQAVESGIKDANESSFG